ncbi:MAG: Gfo/Idh/MocA family oxidoreductase [Clostridia bacterium]|nr:Gfo/Idh/MocA family oxidoreductase [Clostridia bacterium]
MPQPASNGNAPLRVGLIGCGGIAQVHASVIAALPPETAILAAVYDIMEERAQALAGQFGAKVLPCLDAMLEGGAVDAVHLCTPHDLHVPHTLAALRNGLHVLSEKPAAISFAELDALEEAAAGSVAQYGVCLQNRYLPATRRAQELLAGGGLGNILGSRAMISWRREGPYYSESGWRGTWAHEGGGVMINQAIHTLDLQCLLCGQPTRYEGSMHNLHLGDQIETEDTCQLRMEFPGGAVGLLHASVSYALDAPVLLEVHCEHGALRMEGDALYLREGDGPWEHQKLPVYNPPGKLYWGAGHVLLIRDFYQAIAESRPFQIGFKEGTRVLRPLLKFYEEKRGQLIQSTK